MTACWETLWQRCVHFRSLVCQCFLLCMHFSMYVAVHLCYSSILVANRQPLKEGSHSVVSPCCLALTTGMWFPSLVSGLSPTAALSRPPEENLDAWKQRRPSILLFPDEADGRAKAAAAPSGRCRAVLCEPLQRLCLGNVSVACCNNHRPPFRSDFPTPSVPSTSACIFSALAVLGRSHSLVVLACTSFMNLACATAAKTLAALACTP